MRRNYPERIYESVEEPTPLERQRRGQPTGARVQMLLLLKSGVVRACLGVCPWSATVSPSSSADGPPISSVAWRPCWHAGPQPAGARL
jgi:hypothetical protein